LTTVVGAVSLLCVAAACKSGVDATNQLPARVYRVGFSGFPPRLETPLVLRTIDEMSRHADAALVPLTPPWKSMLADTSPAFLVRREQAGLVQLYRGKHFPIVAMIDVTDGLARDREAPELVALHRSITEAAVQAKYKEYVLAVDSILHPDYLALAMETNLIRFAAPAAVYDAVRVMTNAVVPALRAQHTTAKLYVSVQVDVAWGRLQGTTNFIGIDQDLRDFPFIEALGLSAYPYLAGFATPEDVPLDYYSRLEPSSGIPMLVVEGGWTSGSIGAQQSSPDEQARWISRQVQLADRANLAGIFQITYTDLDAVAYGSPPNLAAFTQLGLVDTAFHAKPALAAWDSAFRRPYRR
jgi:hypothetical protein